MEEGWDQLVLVGAQLRAEEIPELFLLGVVAVGHMDQAGLCYGMESGMKSVSSKLGCVSLVGERVGV